jgi:hypothetical protein
MPRSENRGICFREEEGMLARHWVRTRLGTRDVPHRR